MLTTSQKLIPQILLLLSVGQQNENIYICKFQKIAH